MPWPGRKVNREKMRLINRGFAGGVCGLGKGSHLVSSFSSF